MSENLAKKIKKNLYGKPQAIQVVFPAGMGETALHEVQFILNNLWFKQKYISEFSVLKNQISIHQIHLFAVTELLMRSQSLADIRLIIFEGSASGKSIFKRKCLDINWDFYVDKKCSLKIKVNSVASRAFHESGLKEILSQILMEYVDEIVTGEDTHETTCLYVDLYKNKLTISLSLAGKPLYQRGYRQVLSKSAPLREDAAFCCLARALQFANQIDPNYLPDTLFIPFAGTGTFAFEYIQSHFKFPPVLFARNYALNKLPFFNPENFNFLLKKAKENVSLSNDDLHIICIDNSKNAVFSLLENATSLKKTFEKFHFSFSDEMIECAEEDFFKMDLKKVLSKNKNSNSIFMPINPPYGIRLGTNKNTLELYKKIANRINEISLIALPMGKKLLGFILCPDENSWSQFSKTLKHTKLQTYHFTQGGLDIRVCQFFS